MLRDGMRLALSARADSRVSVLGEAQSFHHNTRQFAQGPRNSITTTPKRAFDQETG
jgi:hypothetical protein